MKNPSVNSIDANLRQIVYSSAIRSGGTMEQEFLRSKLSDETVRSERDRIIATLGATKDAGKEQDFKNDEETGACVSNWLKKQTE
jgi:hypothetical protein